MKKRILSLLMAIIMIIGCLSTSANAKTSEWRYWAKGFNGVKAEGLCTHQYENHYRNSYWGAVAGHNCTNYIGYMLTMKGLHGVVSGNANAWDDYARNNGYRVDATPTVGSIAQWNSTYSSYGHVAFVEEVNPGYIVISEDNYGGDYDYRFINRGDPDWPENFIHFRDGPAFDHQSSTPAQKPWIELLAPSNITETRVKLNAKIHNPGGAYISRVGCKILLADDTVLIDYTEPMNSSVNTKDNVDMWFWTDSEMSLTLNAGTVYYYRMSILTSDGTVIRSDTSSFRTADPPAPSNAVLKASIDDGAKITVGEQITFNLSADNALRYHFAIYKDNVRIIDDKNCDLTVKMTLTEPGEYYAYFSADNGRGEWKDSNIIKWTVTPYIAPPGSLPVDSTERFTDVQSGKWYTEYVDYVAENKLMNGMSENTFAPSDTLTRAMFVQILANAAGVDTSNRDVTTKFTDVPSGKWYTPAIKWASENDIVNGMTENTFDPQGNIQRQQMCVMLTRFAKAFGIEFGGSAEKAAFSDDNLIQNYAKEAVYTCQQAGIINGMTPDTFAPRDNATRAQIAKIMTVFHRDFMNA